MCSNLRQHSFWFALNTAVTTVILSDTRSCTTVQTFSSFPAKFLDLGSSGTSLSCGLNTGPSSWEAAGSWISSPLP
ncbi:hypothetical protein EDD22DRAFT_924990 [Suillus occidentalis]|nr:hypothetical protein EDD22DRAFT_924990 [Suillus occidentalis]